MSTEPNIHPDYRGVRAGDGPPKVESCSLCAGQGVGLVSYEQSAAEIVHKIKKEAKSVLGRLAALPNCN
jgi:hypothetical protein